MPRPRRCRNARRGIDTQDLLLDKHPRITRSQKGRGWRRAASQIGGSNRPVRSDTGLYPLAVPSSKAVTGCPEPAPWEHGLRGRLRSNLSSMLTTQRRILTITVPRTSMDFMLHLLQCRRGSSVGTVAPSIGASYLISRSSFLLFNRSAVANFDEMQPEPKTARTRSPDRIRRSRMEGRAAIL